MNGAAARSISPSRMPLTLVEPAQRKTIAQIVDSSSQRRFSTIRILAWKRLTHLA
jgi:hypothetical protein